MANVNVIISLPYFCSGNQSTSRKC